MELFTERYAERLVGVLSCYDRIVITGTLPGAGVAGESSPFTIPVARAVAYERESGSGKAHGALALPPRIWLRRIRTTTLHPVQLPFLG